jgi:hypothetical protein
MHVSDELIVGNPLNPEAGEAHRDRGRTHLRLFTLRALTELCRHHGLEPVRTRTVGYYPLPPPLARLATRVDPVHGAFATGLFRPTAPKPRSAQAADRGLEGVEGGLRPPLDVEQPGVQAPEVAEDRGVGLRVPPSEVHDAP